MMDFLRRLAKEEDGPTSVEYAVMLAMIVAVCMGSVALLSNSTAASFDDSASQLSTVLGS
jgi:pilus assembly protein Flp/PilA